MSSVSPRSTAEPSPLTRHDTLFGAAIFLTALLLFWHSPVTFVGDSKYTLLLTQSLLSRGSFALDGYGLPRNLPLRVGSATLDGDEYQLEIARNHLYYYFPPGSSILSAPFVAIADCVGFSPVKPDHSYSLAHDRVVQRVVASLLMATLAAIFYFTARLLLPVGWSALIALGGVLGTQVWSTASRALWAHTWGVALLGSALLLFLAPETGRRKSHPILLATVLSWTYFVRPTNSLFILGITVYLLFFRRAQFVAYAATGAAWGAAFVAYSWTHFGKLLPSYYQTNRLETTQFWEALAGNLFSPSRGVFVYVPVSLFVMFLVARSWQQQPYRRLVWLTVGVSTCHLLAVSCFVPWHGGGCYGPRYTTELVPWFVLLAVLGTRATLSSREAQEELPRADAPWKGLLAAGGTLLLLSVWINGRGANEIVTRQWNQHPVDVDVVPARVWDWRYPQILAGIIHPPLPAVFPNGEGQRITFGHDAGKAFLWDGWSVSDPGFCWSEGHRAALIFAADDLTANPLRLSFHPFLHGRRVPRQRVAIRLNGRTFAALTTDQPGTHEYVFPLPPGLLQRKNVLTFDLPDAVAPESVGSNPDDRPLGIALSWMELQGDRPAGTTVP